MDEGKLLLGGGAFPESATRPMRVSVSSICTTDIDGHEHTTHDGDGSHAQPPPLSIQGKGPRAMLEAHEHEGGGDHVVVLGERDSADRIHHLLHHLHNYHTVTRRRTELLIYMGLTLIYFGVACTLLGANMFDQAFIEQNYYLPFHYAEFWSAFLFTLLEAFILVSAGFFDFGSWFQRVFLVVVAVNIVSALVAALLLTFEPHFFERPAHLIEYSSQVTVTLANFIFIIQTRNETRRSVVIGTSVLAGCLVVVAVLKFFFYLDVISTAVGPERGSHYFEFTGEMVNSLWAFVFALQQFVRLSALQERHNDRLKDE